MDVLSDVLESVRLQSVVFTQSELIAPWGIRAGPRDHYAFHLVGRGRCLLEAEGGERLVLEAGDFVVLGPGRSHVVRDGPQSRVRPLEVLLAEGAFSAKPPKGEAKAGSTLLICGCFRVSGFGGERLKVALPDLILVRERSPEVDPWIAQTLRLVSQESFAARPGSRSIVNRLCDALFAYLLRAELASSSTRASWLRALSDPQIGEALALIHAQPTGEWTVATLAAKVGMSRSAFAQRFSQLSGETPMQYLTRWRLETAARLLQQGRDGLAEIAGRVGYESEAAFNRAFKRTFGMTPGAFRRTPEAPRA